MQRITSKISHLGIFLKIFNLKSLKKEPDSVSVCDNVSKPDEVIFVKINDSETWYSKDVKFVSLAEIRIEISTTDYSNLEIITHPHGIDFLF